MTERSNTSEVVRARSTGRVDWWGEALLLALVIAETAAIWPLVDLLLGSSGTETTIFSPLVLFMLLYAGCVLPRVLDLFNVWEPRYQAFILIGVVVSTLAAIKIASFPDLAWTDAGWLESTAQSLIFRENDAAIFVWGVVVLSAYAWWRGRMRDDPGPESAFLLLRVGTPVVLFGTILRAVASSADADKLGSRTVLIFFASDLAAIGIARLRTERERSYQQPGGNPAAAYLLPVALVALVALFGAVIFSQDLLETAIWFLSPLIWALTVIFRILVIVLAVIAFVILSPILWLLSEHPIRFGAIKLTPSSPGSGEPVDQARRWASAVPDSVRYLVALAILAILFSSVTKFILRRRRKPGDAAIEERSFVLSAGDLLDELGKRLKRLFRRGGRVIDPLDALRHDPRWRYTVAIRETYRDFLTWCREERVPRDLAATPAEHAGSLAPLLVRPEARTALLELTERYNLARYAPIPASAADAEAARRAWRTLKQTSKQG
jgi:Domain of unknown function (DUF4129)